MPPADTLSPGSGTATSTWPFLTLQSRTAMSAALRAFVAKGITGVRDVGSPLETISALSRRIENGELVGPRIYFAGPLLSQPPLYEQLQGLNRSLPGAALSVESVAAIDTVLDRLVEQGATMTKAINRWDPAFFRHYLDAAEARSLRVVLDPGLPILHDVPVDLALALGVKSIEHAMAPWPAVLREDLKLECDAFIASGQSCESGNELRFRIMALGKASVSQEKLATLADTWTRSGAYFCPTLLVNENWRRHPPPMPEPHPAGATHEQWLRSLQGSHEVGLMFTREAFGPWGQDPRRARRDGQRGYSEGNGTAVAGRRQRRRDPSGCNHQPGEVARC